MVLLTGMLSACAANTMYRGVPVTELSDEQLVEELASAVEGYGIEFNRGMYLMATRPEPAYVLTSSTTYFSGSQNATYNAYVMPTGYGASIHGRASGTVRGTATTRYRYTDVKAGEQLGHAIATLISQSRREAYRRRGIEVLDEYQRRVTERRTRTEELVRDFFAQNPDLDKRRTLVAAVAPWAAAEGHMSPDSTLQRTKEIIENLVRDEGLTGTWYGTFAQTTTTEQGEVLAFSEFMRIDLEQQGTTLSGHGILGSGEVLEFTGELEGEVISASVANTTSAINVKLEAVAASNQIAGEFAGYGTGMRLEGTFALLR